MSQMPTDPGQAQAASKPKKPQSPATLILRISLLVVLAILAIALVFDRRARSACEKSYKAITELTKNEDIPRSEVLKTVKGRKPHFEEKGNNAIDTFSWRSGMLIKSFTVSVHYTKIPGANDWILKEVVHNKKIPMPK